MRASYNATENSLTELPAMMRPEDWHYWHDDEYKEKLAEYNAHLATLRTIPCRWPAKKQWKDQQILTEGVDYELREAIWIPETEEEYREALHDAKNELPSPTRKCVYAFPLPVKSEQGKEKTFTLSELKEIIRGRMYTMPNGRQPREGCNVLFYNLIYFLEHGEEDPDS